MLLCSVIYMHVILYTVVSLTELHVLYVRRSKNTKL